MANYIATDTDLTAVADAIRAKSGGSSSLTFPSGFVSEIEAIPTGGAQPTLYTPNYRFDTYWGDGYGNSNNGKFVERYDIYDSSNNTLLISKQTSVNDEWTYLTNDDAANIAVGVYFTDVYAKATNFNDSLPHHDQTGQFTCFGITKSLTHCTETTGFTKFINGTFTLHLEADNGYVLPDSVSITYPSSLTTETVTLVNGVETKINGVSSSNFRATYTKANGNIVFANGYNCTGFTLTVVAEAGQSGYVGTIQNTGYMSFQIIAVDGTTLAEPIDVSDTVSVTASTSIELGDLWAGEVISNSGCTYTGDAYEGITIYPTADNWTFVFYCVD